jgi:hypothetical protein
MLATASGSYAAVDASTTLAVSIRNMLIFLDRGLACRHRATDRPVIVPAVAKTANQLNASGGAIKFKM